MELKDKQVNDDGIKSKEGNKFYDGSLYNMMKFYSVQNDNIVYIKDILLGKNCQFISI